MFSFVRAIPLLGFLIMFSTSITAQHQCFSEYHLENSKVLNKEYQEKIKTILENKTSNRSNDNLGLITIPIVVHIIHNTDAQNISDEQVYSQIDVLNTAFNMEAPWITSIYPQAADMDIQFVLANVDPNGNSTTGITRTSTAVDIFNISPDQPLDFPENTYMKLDSEGGKDPWPSDSYLNIWVINCQYYIKGFGTLPGTIDASLDGIVMNYKYFGNIETGTTYVNYAGGKSCVHEIGHWLDLRHIFANNDCAVNDGLPDTPAQENYHFSCAAPIDECGNTLMLENYMQYTYDQCQMVYTEDQKTVMRSNFLPGSFRESILTSNGYQDNNLSKIHGTFWHDSNSNGNIDTNESRYSNVNIKLYTCNNQLIENHYSDNQGYYEFNDIPSGQYYIIVDKNTLPAGMGPDPIWFEFFGCAPIINGNTYLQDFALLNYASVSGTIWQETNYNGNFDTNEDGVESVDVHIYNDQFVLVKSTETNFNGQYNINDIYPGDYYLSIEPPNGLSITPQPTTSHYFHQTNGPNTSPTFTFSPGYNMLDLNAALGFGTVALEDLVFNGQEYDAFNLIEWKVNNNHQLNSIELQKKTDIGWQTIFVSNEIQNSAYNDSDLQETTQYYRLKVTRQSGDTKYTDVIALHNKVSTTIQFQNPIQENLYINFNNQDFTTINVSIFNTEKRLLHQKYQASDISSSGQIVIEMSHLPAGIYYLDYEIGTERYVKKLLKIN